MATVDLIVLFTFFGFVMLFLSYIYKDAFEGMNWMQFLSSLLITILAIFIMTTGIGRTQNWLTVSIGIIILATGLITMLVSVLGEIGKDRKYKEDF